MQKSKKRTLVVFSLTLFLIVCCTLLSTIFVSASWGKEDEIPVPTVKKDVYVYDEDNIIDEDVETKLNLLLVELEKKTSAEVVVITVESLLGNEIEDYSYELANTLGIGKADEDNGVLLLISKSDERVRLEIGKGLEGCLNDSKCGRILDNYFVPYREKDEYSEGTYKTIEAVVSVVAKEYQITIGNIDDTVATQLQEQEEQEAQAMATMFLIVIIVVAILLACDGIFLHGAVIKAILDGISSSSGSGGSFGGGSFGGGGASR